MRSVCAWVAPLETQSIAMIPRVRKIRRIGLHGTVYSLLKEKCAKTLSRTKTRRSGYCRRYLILPATMVAMGAPLNVRPSKGELRDLLGESFTLYVHPWV